MPRPLTEIVSELWREGNMPSIARQTPPRPTTSFPSGSVLAGAVPVTSLREGRVKVCTYGRNRSGKTTLACCFKKPLLLVSSEPDANGGANSVTNVEGVFINRVSNKLLGKDKDGHWVDADDPRCVVKDKLKGSAKVVAIANELLDLQRQSIAPFATVVLDTVTSLQDVILVELMGLPKVPEMLSWGFVPEGVYQQRAEKLRETIRPLLDLNNCNVVILAQEKDHNAAEDRGGKNKLMHTMQQGSFMAPALGATNAQWLQDACGYVVQIYEDEVTQEVAVPMSDAQGRALPPVVQRVGTGRRQRHLRLLYHPNFAAGGRWQYNRDMPEFVTAPTPEELYAAMAAYIPALR